MLSWLLSNDIVGGISPPDDFIEQMNKKGDYSGLWIIAGIFLIAITICVSIYLIRNYLDKKHNYNETIKTQKIEETNITELKCLICNNDSEGKHFCKSCYEKNKNATIEIKITTIKPSLEDEEEHK